MMTSITPKEPTRLVICGGGNGAHAWAGIASSQQSTSVRVLTLHEGGAERWSKALQTRDFEVTLSRRGQESVRLTTKPEIVTKHPEEAIPGSDVIAFVTPAFAHEKYLRVVKPFLRPGMLIVGLPGQCGFEYQVEDVLGELARECTLVNFESLPWACRTTEFGVSCNVLGTKDSLLGAMRIGKVPPRGDPIAILQHLLGEKPALNIRGHSLGATLMSTNAYLHTAIIYGRWASWDGTPLDEPPLSYHGIQQDTADLLSGISDEIIATARVIAMTNPSTDMSQVEHVYSWYLRCYSGDILDKSRLMTCLTTNEALRGLRHPMKATDEGKLVPDFEHRYLTEDLPYGLLVIRGIAELAGVATPNIDKVILWAQRKLNKSYLVDGKVQGRDIIASRAPQRYGYASIKDLL